MRLGTLAVAAALTIVHLPALHAQHAHAPASAEKLGRVHFPTSCAPTVAPQFDRAVALLHSFEFGASIRAFEGVAAADSTCAMAHWGIALSRWTNPMSYGIRGRPLLEAGKRAADAAARLAAGATPRERGYVEAVAQLYADHETRAQPERLAAYERAMAALARREPADTEATVFHALALAAAAPPTDKTYANQLAAGRLLEPLWAAQPDHPGLAHYIIHAYDVPALAGRARAAASRYAAIAPSAAHALHMPSHTFTRVGLWEESIATNLRSMNTALESASISEALHAADYAVYAYLQLGRNAEAKSIVDRLPSLAARFDPNAITGAAPASAAYFALAAIPARYVLERRAWREAAALQPRTTAFPYADAMTWYVRALGASRTGAMTQSRVAIDSLEAFRARLQASGEQYWAEQVALQHLTAAAWLDLAEGRRGRALQRMREAVAREEATEKSAVSPGPLAPGRELLADMLMQLGRRTEATREYRRTLEREPNRRHAMRSASR